MPYTGTIIHAAPYNEYTDTLPIIVIPDGSVVYFETIVYTLRHHGKICVLCEIGGPCCHLIVDFREKQGLNIFHLPNARNLLPDKTRATLFPDGSLIY